MTFVSLISQLEEAVLSDARRAALRRKHGIDSPDGQVSGQQDWYGRVLDQMAEADPSPSGEYTDWLFRNWMQKKLRWPEDADKMREQLTAFHRIKRAGQYPGERDINKIDPASLYEIYKEFGKVKSKKEQKRFAAQQGTEILVRSDERVLIKVTNEHAAAELFRHTNWCVADPRAFASYEPKIFYYFADDTEQGLVPLALLHIPHDPIRRDHLSVQFMDPNDSPMRRSKLQDVLPLMEAAGLTRNPWVALFCLEQRLSTPEMETAIRTEPGGIAWMIGHKGTAHNWPLDEPAGDVVAGCLAKAAPEGKARTSQAAADIEILLTYWLQEDGSIWDLRWLAWAHYANGKTLSAWLNNSSYEVPGLGDGMSSPEWIKQVKDVLWDLIPSRLSRLDREADVNEISDLLQASRRLIKILRLDAAGWSGAGPIDLGNLPPVPWPELLAMIEAKGYRGEVVDYMGDSGDRPEETVQWLIEEGHWYQLSRLGVVMPQYEEFILGAMASDGNMAQLANPADIVGLWSPGWWVSVVNYCIQHPERAPIFENRLLELLQEGKPDASWMAFAWSVKYLNRDFHPELSRPLFLKWLEENSFDYAGQNSHSMYYITDLAVGYGNAFSGPETDDWLMQLYELAQARDITRMVQATRSLHHRKKRWPERHTA